MSDTERWLYPVLVVGPSMAPTLKHGDSLLVRRTSTGRPGDVAVVTFAGDDARYVKRLSHEVQGGWWALGDNPLASSDSRQYGPAQVIGKVVLRWWPRPARVRSGDSPGR